MTRKKKDDLGIEANYTAEIIKKYGNVISTGLKVLAKKKVLKTLPVSPVLDFSLNGGIVEGSVTVVTGPPKCGKTSLCIQICANAQKDNREVIYLDAESRLKDYNLQGCYGLDLNTVKIIESEEDAPPLAAEDYLKILEVTMSAPENKGAVVVVDSSSSLIPRAELDMDPSATIRASLPKLLSHWLKKNAQTIKNQKIILIFIRHLITNTSGYGKHKLYDSGEYLQYQADTLIDCKRSDPWLESGEKIGLEIEWDILTSSKGSSGKKCISYFRFDKGVDFTQEILTLGLELGLIDKSGAWYSMPFLETEEEQEKKYNGVANVYQFLDQNPDKFEILNKAVREMLYGSVQS